MGLDHAQCVWCCGCNLHCGIRKRRACHNLAFAAGCVPAIHYCCGAVGTLKRETAEKDAPDAPPTPQFISALARPSSGP